jgi:hypothetical protein
MFHHDAELRGLLVKLTEQAALHLVASSNQALPPTPFR